MRCGSEVNMEKTVGFIGFGHIATAVAKGLIRTRSARKTNVFAFDTDADKLKENAKEVGVSPVSSLGELVKSSDFIVVAVTAKAVPAALAPIADKLSGKIVVSFAAGYGFEEYSRILPDSVHRISAIPNIPFEAGEGMLLCENRHSLTDEEYAEFAALFGKTAVLETVSAGCFNAAGTLSGCAPAYVAMFVEALADAGVKYGVPRDTAYKIAAQVAVGAGKLCLETKPSGVKDAVCSPAGTTIRGVASLEKDGFRGAVINAIDSILGK